jgi:hypothetical protein
VIGTLLPDKTALTGLANAMEDVVSGLTAGTEEIVALSQEKEVPFTRTQTAPAHSGLSLASI